jgi:hypothetical protein
MSLPTLPSASKDADAVRKMITAVLRLSRKSREQVAEQMSALLGTTVTKRALDSYTSEAADQNRFPLEYVRAFCVATEHFGLLQMVAGKCGFKIAGPKEQSLQSIGRATVAKEKAEERIAKLRAGAK